MTQEFHLWERKPQETDALPEKYLHPVFTTALFTTAKIRKQPKCPSMGKQRTITRYVDTREFYSAIE